MTATFARFDLGLSDCLEDDDENAGQTTHFYLHLDENDTPWVQFTYEGLRRYDGSSVDLMLGHDGFWRHNNLRWSDVTISFEPIKRFVVGKVGSNGIALGHFDTLDETYAFQKTLDQDKLGNGDYYLDDMELGEA